MKEIYFEDLTPGRRFVSRGVTFSEADIIDFGLRYDPQPFHIDRCAAEQSPYGGIIASGFHTLALTFRMYSDLGVLAANGLGSPGIDELRWLAPVRPGDTLHAEVEVIEARPSGSRADRGIVRSRHAALNQRGETVMTFLGTVFVRRRAD